jgi:enterochelin esterase family protein
MDNARWSGRNDTMNEPSKEARKPGEYPLGPDSYYQEGVPRGSIARHTWANSRIYPGTTRDYWIYVPAQYDPARPAALMVFQDGGVYADTDQGIRVPIVFDNLIQRREMPVTIGLFVNPGAEREEYQRDPRDMFAKYPGSQRAEEYDVLDDRYARFLLEEMLPEVGRQYRLTEDPEGRAIGGASSGAICAWTVAWHRPDAFRKVLSIVGSFADIRGGHAYPFLIRKTPPKPIRIFLQANTDDLDCVWGHWFLASQNMAAALKFKGYDYQLVIGDGGHDQRHAKAILPDALRWLWRDYPRT